MEAPHNTEFYECMGKKHFCSFQTAENGKQTPNSGVKGRGANQYPRAPAPRDINTGDILARVQSVGKLPVRMDRRKISASAGEISSAVSFRMVSGRLSGPLAFLILRSLSTGKHQHNTNRYNTDRL